MLESHKDSSNARAWKLEVFPLWALFFWARQWVLYSRLALLSSSSNPKCEREQEDHITVCRGVDSGRPAAGIELKGAVTPPNISNVQLSRWYNFKSFRSKLAISSSAFSRWDQNSLGGIGMRFLFRESPEIDVGRLAAWHEAGMCDRRTRPSNIRLDILACG